MNKPSRIIPFVLGLLLGALGAVFLPGYARPYLPEWVMGKGTVVKGIVAAKQKKETALLLTVNTAEGALLVTFTKKVDEIALLVNEKDIIEFTLPQYAPLIDDPKITRILKGPEVSSATTSVGTPAEKGAMDAKAQQQGRVSAVAPAQGSTDGKKQLERK